MQNADADNLLPSINSYEECEKLKLNSALFEKAALKLIARHHLPNEPLKLFEGTNIVLGHGNRRIIKIFPPVHTSHSMHEALVIKHLNNRLSVKTPEIEHEGQLSGWPYIIMNQIDGDLS